MLTQQFRNLEKNDVIQRTVYIPLPPIMESSLCLQKNIIKKQKRTGICSFLPFY
ncbi:hypothetical protein [Bacillus fungorum]|uniref:hypothetical protein n=1 Tax=Bacillus fungorum TaxID=2039284 RepID=UPI003399E974